MSYRSGKNIKGQMGTGTGIIGTMRELDFAMKSVFFTII